MCVQVKFGIIIGAHASLNSAQRKRALFPSGSPFKRAGPPPTIGSPSRRARSNAHALNLRDVVAFELHAYLYRGKRACSHSQWSTVPICTAGPSWTG